MQTLVLERGGSVYLTNAARVARTQTDVSEELVEAVEAAWDIEQANPFIKWIAGDFVEADNPNRNRQFWTAGDLEMAEYSIKYAPLNMVHKFRTPVGFYAATKQVKLERDEAAEAQGSMKIQALSGLWSHIFPFEATQVDAADEAGLLFYSMECRGTHLICAGEKGCGEKFEYAAVGTHCEHLRERTSIRHIVNPTFRGGALIVPPVRPGWAEAHASVLTDAVMQEAASYAEQNEAAYLSLAADGVDITASAWEQLMAMTMVAAGR